MEHRRVYRYYYGQYPVFKVVRLFVWRRAAGAQWYCRYHTIPASSGSDQQAVAGAVAGAVLAVTDAVDSSST